MHVLYVAPAGSCTSPDDTQPYSHHCGAGLQLQFGALLAKAGHTPIGLTISCCRRVSSASRCVLHTAHDVLFASTETHGIPSLGFPWTSSPLPRVPTLKEPRKRTNVEVSGWNKHAIATRLVSGIAVSITNPKRDVGRAFQSTMPQKS